MQALKAATIAIIIATVFSQACPSWTYPFKPDFPSVSKVEATVTALPDGFLFNMTNIPVMENVLLTIPDLYIQSRDEIPNEKLDALSSGTTCHFENSKLVCPKTGSIFSNPRFHCDNVTLNGCPTLNCNWKLTIAEVMHAGRVKKQQRGDTTLLTFYYYISYLTPQRLSNIQKWGHGSQDLFQFHASIHPVYHDRVQISTVHATYLYYVRPETFQPIEYITISTSQPDDVMHNITVDQTPLDFFKTLEWSDKGYTLLQFEANRGVPREKRQLNTTLTFRGTYCSGASKNTNGGWDCSRFQDPLVNINSHMFEARDLGDAPAILTTNAQVYHCSKIDVASDCKPRPGPIPIGAGVQHVIWRSEQLAMSQFEFDPTTPVSVRMFFEDSWMGQGVHEFQFKQGDYDIIYPRDFPATMDPSINPDNKLILLIRFNPTENLRGINPMGSWLDVKVGVRAILDGVNTQESGITTPTISITTGREYKGVAREPFSMPTFGWVLIGISSAVVLAVFVVALLVGARSYRAKKYTPIV
jgi:hypothetical protein